MKKQKDQVVYIKHIRDQIEDIERFLRGWSEKRFIADVKTQKAVARSLEIIGEAVKNLTGKFRLKYPDVDWEGQAGLRDVIVHDYFNLDLPTIWEVVRNDLPLLKKQIKKILEEEDGE